MLGLVLVLVLGLGLGLGLDKSYEPVARVTSRSILSRPVHCFESNTPCFF